MFIAVKTAHCAAPCISGGNTISFVPGASAHRVRHAYRRMAQRFHPDKHPGGGDSATVMARINEAYAVLSDPARRAAYDAALQPPAGASRRAATAADLQDRFGWSGWLLLAILSIAVLTLGYVALKALAPAAPVFRPPASSAARPVDSTPLAPVLPVQPWTEPTHQARPVNEATDPVARLVREGVITPAAARRDTPKGQ